MIFAPNSIVCGDTLRLLPELADASVDLVIADIPYFEIVDDEWDNQWPSFEAYLDWLDRLFAQFARVLKPNTACYVYCAITYYPHVQLCLNKHLAYAATITWKKQRGRGNGWGFNREEICVNVKGDHVFHDVETATLMLPHLRKGSTDYSNGKKRTRTRDYKLASSVWDDVVASSVWDDVAQACSYRKQMHPTEKPVELARRILEASSLRGDLVLIPFVGSGSECEACVNLVRNYLGFEATQSYCDAAMERVALARQVLERAKKNEKLPGCLTLGPSQDELPSPTIIQPDDDPAS